MNSYYCEATCVTKEPTVEPKHTNMMAISAFFKVLGDDTRLQLLHVLKAKPSLCVCDLAKQVRATVATTSHHLRVMKEAGLVMSQKEGKQVYYALSSSPESDLGNHLLEISLEVLTCQSNKHLGL